MSNGTASNASVDTVFVGGSVFTAGQTSSRPGAVAVSGGRIAQLNKWNTSGAQLRAYPRPKLLQPIQNPESPTHASHTAHDQKPGQRGQAYDL